MSKFWIKIIILVVIIAGLAVFLKFYSGSESSQEQVESSEGVGTVDKTGEGQVPKREDVLAEYRKERDLAVTRAQPVETPPRQVQDLDIQAIEAERLYQFAETQFRIGQKTGMSYKNAIEMCREIIKKFPKTEYAGKARELLRKVPERHRKMWNVTDEEMGL
ncbi:MAG: tetratricopeptide repeat protein [Planctomycetota bacterium]